LRRCLRSIGIYKTSSICGPPRFAQDPGAVFILTACIDPKSRNVWHASRRKGEGHEAALRNLCVGRHRPFGPCFSSQRMAGMREGGSEGAREGRAGSEGERDRESERNIETEMGRYDLSRASRRARILSDSRERCLALSLTCLPSLAFARALHVSPCSLDPQTPN
jgi:hypothetical protein